MGVSNPLGPSYFTNQNDVTGSRALGSEYQNTGSLPMLVVVAGHGGVNQVATAVTDSGSPPTTVVAKAGSSNSGSIEYGTMSFIVLPGNYYKVTWTGTLDSWLEYN